MNDQCKQNQLLRKQKNWSQGTIHFMPEMAASHWRRGFQPFECLRLFDKCRDFGAYFTGCGRLGLDSFALLQEQEK